MLLSVYRFVIGRERPGQVSEVAALIQQTLEQERRQRELLEQQYAQYDADDDEVGSLLLSHPPTDTSVSVANQILYSFINSFIGARNLQQCLTY